MRIKDYIQKVVAEFVDATPRETQGVRQLEFDVGVLQEASELIVSSGSLNRIKFILEVRRS